MEFDKKNILDALNSGLFGGSLINKNNLLANLHSMTSDETTKNSVSNIVESLNSCDDAKNDMAWKFPTTNIKHIINSVIVESANSQNRSPNSFRLDLKSIVIDKCHGKFVINRNSNNVTIDIIYPNANEKITVKLHIDGIDDKVYEVGLEDDQYTDDFGMSIIRSVDSMLNEKQHQNISLRTPEQFSNPSADVSDFSPNWVQNGYSMESAAGYMKELLAIVEAGEIKDDKDKTTNEANSSNNDDTSASDLNNQADENNAGDVNSEQFGKEDFSLGGSPDQGIGDDTSMDAGMGDVAGMSAGMGADSGMPSGSSGDVNSDSNALNSTPDDDYVNFKEFAIDNFSTIKNGTIDVLSNIVGDAIGKQLNNSSDGVKLTNSQLVNGMPGLNTRPAIEIIDAFLKLYPSLNGEFKKSNLETLSEKLEERPAPTEFNQFLEGFMKQMQGDESNDTDVVQLPNAPLEKPMGGEEQAQQAAPDEFSNFIDKSNSSAQQGELNSAEPPANPEEAQSNSDDVDEALKRTAELETNVPLKKEEYPNI